MLALLKAFRPNCPSSDLHGNMPEPLLNVGWVKLVVTMGKPVLAFRFYFGAHGVKSFERRICSVRYQTGGARGDWRCR
jgi:hypothetical protein